MMRIINDSQQLQLHVAWTKRAVGSATSNLRHGKSTFDVSPLTIKDGISEVKPLQTTRTLEART